MYVVCPSNTRQTDPIVAKGEEGRYTYLKRVEEVSLGIKIPIDYIKITLQIKYNTMQLNNIFFVLNNVYKMYNIV